MSGGGDIQIPTPIIGKDLIYFNSAHGKISPIMAVKTNATGDITLKDDETSNPGFSGINQEADHICIRCFFTGTGFIM